MKVNATIKPSRKSFKRNNLLIRFDVQENTTLSNPEAPDEGSTTSYDFNEVSVEKTADYGEIVSAIIREKYSVGHEIALINNQNRETISEEDVAEYVEYQDFRELAKIIAKGVKNLDDLSWNEIREYAVTLGVSASGTREEIEATIEEL